MIIELDVFLGDFLLERNSDGLWPLCYGISQTFREVEEKGKICYQRHPE